MENQIKTRYGVSVTMAYHNVIMGIKQEDYKNHDSIKTVEMTLISSRFCFLKPDLGYPSYSVVIKILNLSLISSSIAQIERERLFRAPESHFHYL